MLETVCPPKLMFLDTTGEIDVFHPKGFDAAVFAVTADKLNFKKLIPGNALAGGSLLKPTMVFVPVGKTLQPDDPSIPPQVKGKYRKGSCRYGQKPARRGERGDSQQASRSWRSWTFKAPPIWPL